MRLTLACLLLLTAAVLCRADPPRRPPQAPPCRHAPRPPQAPPCRHHHDPAPAPPRTEEGHWRADGWQRDSNGQWFRWTPDAPSAPAYHAPAYHPPAFYPQPAPQFYAPVGRFGGGGGGRGGGC